METREVPADILIPGDEVRIDFEIVGDNEAQILTAVHEIKQTIAADARFNYQSGRIVDRWLGEELPAKYLEIYVTVRKTPKQEQYQVDTDTQQAGVLLGVGIAVGALIALVAAASIAHDAVIAYRGYCNLSVSNNATEAAKALEAAASNPNLTDAQREAIIEANLEAMKAAGIATKQLAESAAGGISSWGSEIWGDIKDASAAAADRTEKLATTVSIVAGLVVIAMYFAGRDSK